MDVPHRIRTDMRSKFSDENFFDCFLFSSILNKLFIKSLYNSLTQIPRFVYLHFHFWLVDTNLYLNFWNQKFTKLYVIHCEGYHTYEKHIKKFTPDVGIEPTTTRLKVVRSTAELTGLSCAWGRKIWVYKFSFLQIAFKFLVQ